MASKTSSFELNSASIIGLKAELYRKREEAKETRTQPKVVGRSSKKTPIWARCREKPDKATKKLDSCITNNSDDIDLLSKSRHKLEAKSRLYEELTQSSLPTLDQDDESGYLVDFERKTLERNGHETERQLETNISSDDKVISSTSDNDDDWVEYTDVFGRSRRCLRDDLPRHLQRNDDLRQDLKRKNDAKDELSETDDESQNSADNEGSKKMQESQSEHVVKLKPNLHYADVQNDEVRTHGVGFFQFSTDEATRKTQMKDLKDMRKITEDSRLRRERIKEKRKAQMEMRLAKVKERRMLSSGDSTNSCDPQVKEEKNEEAIAATLSLLRSEVEESRDKHQRNNPFNPRREWDRGKSMMSADKYLEQRRTERNEDFAPPSYYSR